MHDLRQHIAL